MMLHFNSTKNTFLDDFHSLSAPHFTEHLQQKQINLSFLCGEGCIKGIDAKEYCAKLIQHERVLLAFECPPLLILVPCSCG